jgi:hypothetical protein
VRPEMRDREQAHVHGDHSDADRTSGFARHHLMRTRQWPRQVCGFFLQRLR